MTILYRQDDIINTTQGLVVHGTNCRGVFRSGVAKSIREKWPLAYESYMKMTKAFSPEALLGKCHIINVGDGIFVGNCYTQLNYGYDGQKYADPEAIKSALIHAFDFAEIFNLPLKAPKIGAGLGGLSWEREVLPIFEELNNKYPTVNVEILYI